MHKMIKVKGVAYNAITNELEHRILEVRVSNDDYGKSISIADPQTGLMYMIPFEPIEGYLKKRR